MVLESLARMFLDSSSYTCSKIPSKVVKRPPSVPGSRTRSISGTVKPAVSLWQKIQQKIYGLQYMYMYIHFQDITTKVMAVLDFQSNSLSPLRKCRSRFDLVVSITADIAVRGHDEDILCNCVLSRPVSI
jgi:hypothetical protein